MATPPHNGKQPAPPKGTPKSAKPAAPKKAAGKAAPPARKKAAPYSYGDINAAAESILEGIEEGGSLHEVCAKPGVPSVTTFMRWLADERNETLRERYARAREVQAERMAEDILAIADEECITVKDEAVVFDSTAVQRNRLRVDARKWLLSKLAPKKYGDKVTQEHTGANGGAIQVASTVTFVRPKPRPEDEE